jgi:hypothetical protein
MLANGDSELKFSRSSPQASAWSIFVQRSPHHADCGLKMTNLPHTRLRSPSPGWLLARERMLAVLVSSPSYSGEPLI